MINFSVQFKSCVVGNLTKCGEGYNAVFFTLAPYVLYTYCTQHRSV